MKLKARSSVFVAAAVIATSPLSSLAAVEDSAQVGLTSPEAKPHSPGDSSALAIREASDTSSVHLSMEAKRRAGEFVRSLLEWSVSGEPGKLVEGIRHASITSWILEQPEMEVVSNGEEHWQLIKKAVEQLSSNIASDLIAMSPLPEDRRIALVTYLKIIEFNVKEAPVARN